jgi:hypothetical protein
MLGGSRTTIDAFLREENLHFLDGRSVVVDGLKVAGLGGVIDGKPRPYRKDEAAYVDALLDLLAAEPDIVVLHEGPGDDTTEFPGQRVIREALELAAPVLVVRGHKAWRAPLLTLGDTVVLNVDHRVIVMGKAVDVAAS